MSKKNKHMKKDEQKSTIKDLVPRDTDYKYYGYEPNFIMQPDPDLRAHALARSFTWYTRFFDKKDGKEMLVQYLEWLGHTDHAKAMRNVSDSEFMVTLCWLARMNMRGLELTDHESNILSNEVTRLLETLAKPTIIKKEESHKPNIQEIMRERAHEVCGELEGAFDDYFLSRTKKQTELNTVAILTEKNILPQHASILIDTWQKRLDEFQSVYNQKDKDLVLGYSHLTKTQIKNLIKFCETIISDINGYVNIKKSQQPVRKKKVVTPEQLVKNIKFQLKEETLGLRSVNPSKLVGATEIWLYDTAKRRLSYLVADQHAQTMTVKGTTIVGFDSVQSGTKTLRKPAEQLKELFSGGKPAARKFFKDIKTLQTIPSGRMSETVIILKVN
jgi:hypothetical protein